MVILEYIETMYFGNIFIVKDMDKSNHLNHTDTSMNS